MIENGLLDADLRPRDRLGRLVPHRMNFLTFMRAISGFTGQFRDVPAKFYEAHRKRATVNCPCGEQIVASTGDMLACTNCPRIYVWTGKRLLVGNSPVSQGGESVHR